MRLRRLDLLRYGHFTDASLDFGPRPDGPDLHLVYGPNEAGKSTSMAAILDLFFGMQTRGHPYAFLHDVSTLAIGGALEIGDQAHEFVRRRGGASLRMPDGSAADEGVLALGLGGVDRPGFEALFALDDETLERGGEDILASRGDLGEMLFSASAGLSALSRRLGEVRTELDDFDRPRARKTGLRDLTAEAERLQAEIKAHDVPAPEHARLTAALTRARAEHDAATAARIAARTEARRADALLKALPALGRVQALRADLAAAGFGPEVPEGWADDLPDLQNRAARIGADLRHARDDVAALVAAPLRARDPAALAAADAVERLSGGDAAPQERHVTALQDLPSRRDACATLDRQIADLIARLDGAGGQAPETLRLSAAQQGEAAALIAARSGLVAALAAARREEGAATARRAALTAPAAPDQAAAAQAEALREGARALDRSGHRGAAETARLSRARAEAELAAARPGLAPLQRDLAELAAMTPPSAARRDGWRAALATLDADCRVQADARARAGAAADAAAADISARSARIEGLSDRDAAVARDARDAAWADLRAAWSEAGTAAFAAVMAHDDTLTGARLAAAADLAALRRAEDEGRVAGAALAEADALADAAKARRDTLMAEITAAARAVAPGWLDPTLGALDDWIAARDRAMAAAAARDAADADITAAADVSDRLRAVLIATAPEGADDEALSRAALAAAETIADAARAGDAARKALADADRDLAARVAARRDTEFAIKEWDDRHAALTAAAPWLAPKGAPAAEGLASALSLLADLAPLIDRRRDIAARITAMERDRDAFAATVAALAVRMEDAAAPDAAPDAARADPLTAADRLRARLRAARDTETARADHAARLSAARDALADLSRDAESLSARQDRITRHFGVPTLQDAAAAIAAAQTRARLARDLTEAEAALAALVSAPSAGDGEAMLDGADAGALGDALAAAEAAEREADDDAAETRAELREAERTLAAIGMDDDAARLTQAREALLLEIADRARGHLSLRLGLMAAERALRIQRDRLRSDMLEAASAAFATITGGAYPQLRVEPGEDGAETLLAQTAEGPVRRAHELSKGTRFQLYLALRLAGRAELASRRVPAPLLLDDILETFDEDRSAETFRLLGAAATQGQVIYFTHHRHLCDIAKSACPEMRLHQLAEA
jgi:uncharacterized protein YhaN